MGSLLFCENAIRKTVNAYKWTAGGPSGDQTSYFNRYSGLISRNIIQEPGSADTRERICRLRAADRVRRDDIAYARTGRLGAPVGAGWAQELVLLEKRSNGTLARSSVAPVMFVPMKSPRH